jgi:hypothetical protein
MQHQLAHHLHDLLLANHERFCQHLNSVSNICLPLACCCYRKYFLDSMHLQNALKDGLFGKGFPYLNQWNEPNEEIVDQKLLGCF